MVGVEMSSFLLLQPHSWSIVEAVPSTFPFHFHFHFQFRACLLTTRPKYELEVAATFSSARIDGMRGNNLNEPWQQETLSILRSDGRLVGVVALV